MLETIRKKLGKIVVGGIVALISLVFVIQFGGPQAQGCASSGSENIVAARVYDATIGTGDFDAAYKLARFDRHPPARAKQYKFREAILNGLIERALLARYAMQLGFRVDEEQALSRVAEKDSVLLTLGVDASEVLPRGELPLAFRGDDGKFEKDAFRRFVQYHLGQSIAEFANGQAVEMLAEQARALVQANVRISREEIVDAYMMEKDRAQIEYLRFSPRHYAEQATVVPSELQAWANAHKKEIDEKLAARPVADPEKKEDAEETRTKLTEKLYRDHLGKSSAQKAANDALTSVREGMSFRALDRQFGKLRPLPEGKEPPDDEKDAREGQPLAPRRRETRMFARGDSPITGLDSRSVVKKAFELTAEDPLPASPLAIGDEYLVVRLLDREIAKESELDESAQERLFEGLVLAKQKEAIDLLVRRLRVEADSSKSVSLNPTLLEEPSSNTPG